MQIIRRHRALILGSLLTANLLVLGSSAYSLYRSWQQYDLRARSLTQNIAHAVEENVSTLVARIDLVLATTAEELERQLATGGIDEKSANAYIARQEKRLPELEAIRVAAADGSVILGKGLNKAEKPSWADRDYFIALREHADIPLIMSPPRVGRVAKRVIVAFQKRYNYPDGRFAGVVSAPVAYEHFEQLLRGYDLGTGGSIVLRDDNLGLIGRYPPLPDTSAGTIGSTVVSAELAELIRGGNSEATYSTSSGPDKLNRVASFRRSKSIPLVVLTTVAENDFLADWRKEMYTTSALAGGFLLLSLLAGFIAIRLIARLIEETNRAETAKKPRAVFWPPCRMRYARQ